MGTFLFAFLAVTLFCLCAHFFIKMALKPLPLYNESNYSKTALKIEKSYMAFAWGLMTVSFLLALVVSFIQVYTQL